MEIFENNGLFCVILDKEKAELGYGGSELVQFLNWGVSQVMDVDVVA